MIEIVLVNTTHPGNIGATARAMKTMGLEQLCLVKPKIFPDSLATAMSAGAEDILENARVVETLDEAIAESQWVVGTSARIRGLPWPLATPREAAKSILKAEQKGLRVSVVFGREASGLSNKELQHCHLHVNIPTNPDFSSLNLSQAVQILAYEIYLAQLEVLNKKNKSSNLPEKNPEKPLHKRDSHIAGAEKVTGLLAHLSDLMYTTRFIDPKQPALLLRRVHRVLLRSQLTEQEINIFRGLLTHIQWNLKSDPEQNLASSAEADLKSDLD